MWRALTSRITVGKGSIIRPGVRILKKGGRISIGQNCEIHQGAMLLAYGGEIAIGNDVSVNPYTILYGHGGLLIGDGVRIAAHSVVIPSNHQSSPDLPIWKQGLQNIGIQIGADVWIGAGVRILDGARIAEGCIIAAGAVVTGKTNTVPFGVYGGVPARQVSSRLKATSAGARADA
jgi:acetyltransferase-like isoleucine patch superfamily enzyme